MKISDVLAAKASQIVITIDPDATVRELLGLMAQHNIGAVIVSSDAVNVSGIVSERDVVRRLHADPGVMDRTVAAIMTTAVRSVAPADNLDDIRRLMTDQRFRHVPVVQDQRLCGLVSIGDVVKAYIDQVEFERDQLDSYVHQSG